MADINLRAQPLNVFGTVGDDMQIVLTVVDSAGDPIDVSGYTISAKVWRGATEVDEMTDAVSGASNNVITLSLTDTETTAIGTERGLRWSLSMTASSITEQWVGGKFELLNAGHPKASGVSAATLTYTSGNVTVTLGSISTTALDGRYVRQVDHQIWIPATSFKETAAGPTLATVASRYVGWLFDAAAIEQVTCSFEFPSWWTSATFTLYWANNGAGSGDVAWTLTRDSAAVGASIAVSGTASAVTATAGAQNVLVATELVADAAITVANIYNLRILRNATAGGDTLANDAAMLGLLVTPG